jgi:tetratricopeptide (TPR) repeat protein
MFYRSARCCQCFGGSADGCVLVRSPPKRCAPPEVSEDQAFASGEAALLNLNADEWNLHHPAGEIYECVKTLLSHGARPRAEALLERALTCFASGKLDGRGFASGAAYVSLANAASLVHGAAQAQPLLEKASQMCTKTDVAIIRRSLVEAYRDVGKLETALLLAKNGSKKNRDTLLIELLFVACRLSGKESFDNGQSLEAELQQALENVEDPEAAASCAWSIVYKIIERAGDQIHSGF